MSSPSAHPTSESKPRFAWGSFAAVLICFADFVSSMTVWLVSLACVPYYDLGIYSEALYKLSFAVPNPYLVARHLTLFSDHFDPIVWLATPLARVVPPPYTGPLFESIFVALSIVPIYLLHRDGWLTHRATVLVACLMLFNAGMTTALHYPFHPTTWAATPWAVLTVAYLRSRWRLAVAAFFLLCACKEEFPFVALPLAWCLWRKHARRAAAVTAAVGAAWGAFDYVWRPYFVGATVPYYAQPFSGWADGPLAFMWQRLTHPDLLACGPLYILPLVPIFVWLRRQKAMPLDGRLLFLLLPTILIRVLSMKWRHQYHAVTMVGVALALLPALKHREVPRRVLVSTLALLALVNADTGISAWSLLHGGRQGFWQTCPNDTGRRSAMALAERLLHERAQDQRIVAGINLLPKLVDLPLTYALEMPDRATQPPYQFAYFEKPPNGADWPPTHEALMPLLEKWRQQSDTKMLIDDGYIFLAQGQFRD